MLRYFLITNIFYSKLNEHKVALHFTKQPGLHDKNTQSYNLLCSRTARLIKAHHVICMTKWKKTNLRFEVLTIKAINQFWYTNKKNSDTGPANSDNIPANSDIISDSKVRWKNDLIVRKKSEDSNFYSFWERRRPTQVDPSRPSRWLDMGGYKPVFRGKIYLWIT